MDCNRSRRAWRHAYAAVLFALGVLGGAAGIAADGGPSVSVSESWIRWLPANLPAGGYLTLRNGGERPLVLTGASSPAYGEISLHHSGGRDGVNSMQQVARIAIPARTSLNFASAGYHIMLEQPTRPLQPGDHVPITLHFSDGSATTAEFELRRPDAIEPAR